MIRKSEFSLRRLSLSSAVWYGTVISGWALLLAAVFRVATAARLDNGPAFGMTVALLIILELLPLVMGRGHDPQGVVMSTAFVCAVLFVWGVWPAVLAVAVASLASDLRARKNWWKVLFNPAQYALSVGAGYLIILATGHGVSLAHPLPGIDLDDAVWMPGAWVAYFTVNLLLVAGVLAWNTSFTTIVRDDFWHYAAMSFAVMAISPLVVLVGLHSWLLLPLLLVPLLLLYYTSAMALQREHDAGHDPLTNLPNRATLVYRLDETLQRYQSEGTPFGLVVIDMDDFKRVNDTLGHQVGDELLASFAERLHASVRGEDLVARLSGDEFAVIVCDADSEEVVAVAERMAGLISTPISLAGLSIEVEASLGIALCPDHGADATVLLRRADVAMYAAKERRTRVEVYSAARDPNTADRLSLLGELRQALLDDVLELYYQPKVATADSTPIGVEALIRWRHPTRGFIPPDEFIPLAERSGIMPLLTEKVISLALAQVARWRELGMAVPVAVNIAPTDLTGGDLAAVIARCLADYDVPSDMLRLEITERIVTHQLEDTKRTLRRLRDMGVTISLDDFGTGYSSLLRLSTLQVDEIKIDRGFVSAMSQGERAVGIVRTLIELAHTLGVPSIAEGVETADELSLLQSLGCDGVQGWHVAMPMSQETATEWLRTRVTRSPFLRVRASDGARAHRAIPPWLHAVHSDGSTAELA